VARRLKTLPPLWQAILLMAKRDGLSADEIARKVNLSKKTVYIYLGYAIAQFKQDQNL
jgi:DNA-directed RNA polymerase specialized sigma24 family protein